MQFSLMMIRAAKNSYFLFIFSGTNEFKTSLNITESLQLSDNVRTDKKDKKQWDVATVLFFIYIISKLKQSTMNSTK